MLVIDNMLVFKNMFVFKSASAIRIVQPSSHSSAPQAPDRLPHVVEHEHAVEHEHVVDQEHELEDERLIGCRLLSRNSLRKRSLKPRRSQKISCSDDEFGLIFIWGRPVCCLWTTSLNPTRYTWAINAYNIKKWFLEKKTATNSEIVYIYIYIYIYIYEYMNIYIYKYVYICIYI